MFRMISDRSEAFLVDKGYDADAIRDEIARTEVEAVIPSKSNRREPIPHDKAKESYLGFLAIAAVKLWIPFVHER